MNLKYILVRLFLKSIAYPSIPLPIPHPKCYFMYILASFYHYVQTLSCFSVSAFSGPLKSTFLDDLQKNKNGIHVSTETDFGKVELGGRKKLTVWIQNKGETNQVFLRAHLPAECTQIKVQGLYSHSLCKWNKIFYSDMSIMVTNSWKDLQDSIDSLQFARLLKFSRSPHEYSHFSSTNKIIPCHWEFFNF